MPPLFIIFGILLLITIIVIIIRKSTRKKVSDECNSNADCPQSDTQRYTCIYNPEQKRKQCFPLGTSFCKIDPPTDLTQCKCDLDKDGNCINSLENCSTCLNTPSFSCINVTDTKPYIWKQGDKQINIPNSEQGYGWCLPNVENRSIVCNPFTSDYILAETGDGNYQWGCYCKHENLFEHVQGPLSDCTLVKACRTTHGTTESLGKLYVPDTTNIPCTKDTDCNSDPNSESSSKCLSPQIPYPCGYDSSKGPQGGIISNDCSDPKNNCVCHTEWKGDITNKVDPLTGQCVCNPGLDYQCVVRSNDYFELNCVKGFCDGFGTDNSQNCNQTQCYSSNNNCTCCKCPQGYIRCPDDIPPTNEGLILYCQDTGPTCIIDPCSTKDVPNGYFDPSLPGCVCPGDNNIAIPDENSAVGQICINACKGNGPCGNRGKCYLPPNSKSYLDAMCCDCVCPYTNENDSTCSCSGIVYYIPRNKKKTPKVGLGGSCCEDTDCCSNNCNLANCEHGRTGVCIGNKVISSPCGKSTCQKSVLCPDGTECAPGETCCPGNDNKYTCCPYTNGICCDNNKCCPPDKTCCETGCC